MIQQRGERIMKRFAFTAAGLAVAGLVAMAIPGASPKAHAGFGPGGGFNDFITVDGCGTITDVPLFLFGQPFGSCRVWVPDGFGFSVRGAQLDQFAVGEKVYIQGTALLAQTNVFPPCPAFPLVSAQFSDCE
jgi:hypothetical protein